MVRLEERNRNQVENPEGRKRKPVELGDILLLADKDMHKLAIFFEQLPTFFVNSRVDLFLFVLQLPKFSGINYSKMETPTLFAHAWNKKNGAIMFWRSEK